MTALPSRSLADAVRYYVAMRLDGVESAIPATAAPILVLFHSGGTRVRDERGEWPMPPAFLAGPSLAAQRSMAQAGTCMVSVLFQPGRLRRFFDVDVNEIIRHPAPLEEVAGRAGREFLEEFREARGERAMIGMTERFLLRQAAHREGRELLTVPGELLFQPVAGLARELGVSARQFQRRFGEHYGVTLRDYRRLVRFERGLADLLLRGAAPMNFASLAQAAGYFDQAHFNRDFRKFSGYSPGRLASAAGGGEPGAWAFQLDRELLRAMTRA